jgi:hypothetical protein
MGLTQKKVLLAGQFGSVQPELEALNEMIGARYHP